MQILYLPKRKRHRIFYQSMPNNSIPECTFRGFSIGRPGYTFEEKSAIMDIDYEDSFFVSIYFMRSILNFSYLKKIISQIVVTET